jgi:regulator-associated protein of mTOR
LVSAWKVDSDSRPCISGNLICEWHQLSGVLYTAGVSPVIKIWDADEELCVQVNLYLLDNNMYL